MATFNQAFDATFEIAANLATTFANAELGGVETVAGLFVGFIGYAAYRAFFGGYGVVRAY